MRGCEELRSGELVELCELRAFAVKFPSRNPEEPIFYVGLVDSHRQVVLLLRTQIAVEKELRHERWF